MLRRFAVPIQFALLALIWGSSFLFMKLALEGLSPSQVVAGRLGLGALTLVIVMVVTRRRWPRDGGFWARMVIVAMLLCVVPFLLFAWAGQHIPSGLSSIYNATTPIMTLLVSLVALPDERLTPRRTIGVIIAAAGVVLVAAPWTITGADGPVSLLAQLACLGATLCYGVGIVAMRRIIRDRREDATTIASVQVSIAAVVALALVPVIGLAPIRLDAPVVVGIVLLGALGTGVAYVWSTRVVQVWGATRASTVTYLTPLVGVVLGMLVLGERLHWNEPVGGVVVLAGVLLAQLGTARRAPRPAPADELP